MRPLFVPLANGGLAWFSLDYRLAPAVQFPEALRDIDDGIAMHHVGAKCDLITIQGGGHGMSRWRDPAMQHWKPETLDWLKKTLGSN